MDALKAVLDSVDRRYEIIIVDDGSTDASAERVARAAAQNHQIKVIEFRRNAGQTAAMMAGIDHASGEIIITIDADLQNDPEDIPSLLAKLDEGYDVVSGWRKDTAGRGHPAQSSEPDRQPLISRISGVPSARLRLHAEGLSPGDAAGLRLYGEMHRFVPIYASWMGAKVVEIPVRHHARRFGQSKYGLERTFKVVLDLLVVKFFSRYLAKPIYVFGGFGFGRSSAASSPSSTRSI